jgi:hypothetical protein
MEYLSPNLKSREDRRDVEAHRKQPAPEFTVHPRI